MFHLLRFTDSTKPYYYLVDASTRTCTNCNTDIRELFNTSFHKYSVDSIVDRTVRYGTYEDYASIQLSFDTYLDTLTSETYPELFL